MRVEVTTRATRVEDVLRKYIAEEVAVNLTVDELTDDYSLLDSGAIDSIGLFEVVGFLERTFGVSLDDNDLVYENFQDLQAIARLVGMRGDEAR